MLKIRWTLQLFKKRYSKRGRKDAVVFKTCLNVGVAALIIEF